MNIVDVQTKDEMMVSKFIETNIYELEQQSFLWIVYCCVYRIGISILDLVCYFLDIYYQPRAR